MTKFTDIDAAIEEAIFLHEEDGSHYKVVQKAGGIMRVYRGLAVKSEPYSRRMFSTRTARLPNHEIKI